MLAWISSRQDYQGNTHLRYQLVKNLWHLLWYCGCLWLDLKSRIWKNQWRPTTRYANHILNIGTKISLVLFQNYYCFSWKELLTFKEGYVSALLHSMHSSSLQQYSTLHLSPAANWKAHFKSTRVSLNIKQVQSDTAKPLFSAPRYSLICTLWK